MDASTQLYRKSEVLTSTGTEPLLSPSLFTAHKPLLCPTPQVLNLLSQTLTSLLLLAWFGRRRGRPRLFSAATRTWSPESFTAPAPSRMRRRGEAAEARAERRMHDASRVRAGRPGHRHCASGALWCGVHGLKIEGLRSSASPLTSLRPLGSRAVMMGA